MGRLIYILSPISLKVGVIEILYAKELAICWTTQQGVFKLNWLGNGSYNLIKIVGSSTFVLSNKILLAIINWLSPKSK